MSRPESNKICQDNNFAMKKKPAASVRLPHISAAGKKKSVEPKEQSLPVQLKPKASAMKEDLMIDGLNNAIHEYLLKNNYAATLDCFQKDVAKAANPKHQTLDYQAKLLEVAGGLPVVRWRKKGRVSQHVGARHSDRPAHLEPADDPPRVLSPRVFRYPLHAPGAQQQPCESSTA